MADNTNRLAGYAWFSIDGVNFMLAGDFTYAPASIKRETLTGQDQVHGYSEMPLAPKISASLRDAGNFSIAQINSMTNVTINCKLANGKVLVGRNMWVIESQEVKTQEATYEVKFEGFDGSVSEQLSS